MVFLEVILLALYILSVFLPFVDETATVELTIFVDDSSAYLLASGEQIIEDILVLHLDGGKDFFVSFDLIL